MLYDDERLDGSQGLKGMRGGENISDFESNFKFDVESIFIKKGCELQIYAGPCITILF